MTPTPEPTCATCGAIEGLRVIQPRKPMTVDTWSAAELRCRACCLVTRGMFRLTHRTVQDHVAKMQLATPSPTSAPSAPSAPVPTSRKP